MVSIESFNFSSDTTGGRLTARCMESAMPDVNQTVAVDAASDPLAAELEAYNRAFCELELPWRWDVQTFRHLVSRLLVEEKNYAYVQRNQPHLIWVYDKAF